MICEDFNDLVGFYAQGTLPHLRVKKSQNKNMECLSCFGAFLSYSGSQRVYFWYCEVMVLVGLKPNTWLWEISISLVKNNCSYSSNNDVIEC